MSLHFSVVMPTGERPALVVRCLEALARPDYPRDRFEVVVVDDGSVPPLADVLPPVPADLFAALGGFRADGFRVASADRELCERWRHAGHRLAYEPRLLLWQLCNATGYAYERDRDLTLPARRSETPARPSST